MEKKMVFILEDNDDIREIVSIILSDAGYQIEQCSTVKEFWLRIITQKFKPFDIENFRKKVGRYA